MKAVNNIFRRKKNNNAPSKECEKFSLLILYKYCFYDPLSLSLTHTLHLKNEFSFFFFYVAVTKISLDLFIYTQIYTNIYFSIAIRDNNSLLFTKSFRR